MASCYRCGTAEQSGRYCQGCGAELLSVQSKAGKRSLIGPAIAAFATTLGVLCVVGIVCVIVFGHREVINGVCFANPLQRTSIWSYDRASGDLSLKYYVDEQRSDPFRVAYAHAIVKAFREWADAWPVLHFYRVASPDVAQIEINHGEYGTHGIWYNHAGLTLPDVDVFGCSLSHATIEINDSYLVQSGQIQYPPPMLLHLLLHEIGHALGLQHVRAPIASVMVPTSAAYRYVKPQPYDVRTLGDYYPMPQFMRARVGIHDSARTLLDNSTQHRRVSAFP